MKILRTASMAIHVRASFVVLALLYALASEAGVLLSLIFLAALFVTFLVHEFGHIIVARLLRRPTETTIGGAGGRTVIFGPVLKTWQRVLVLFSGILASYLLTEGTAWLLQKGLWPHAVVHETLFSIYTFSAVWFWCNLIPLYPFDGGEIAVVVGGALFGRVGRILAAVLNMVVGVSLAIYCLSVGAFPAVIVALYSLTETFLLVRRPQGLHGGVLSDDAQKLHDLQQRWLSGEQEQVVAELRQLSEKSEESDVRKSALDSCSEYLLELDRFREAYDLLINAQDTLQLASLEHLALSGYKTSHWAEALEAGREAFRLCPSLSTASLCAVLSARLSLDEESVGWLRAAQSMGFRNIAEFVSTTDFDSIRSSTALQQFLDGLGS
jgi:hypothetical protein